MYLDKNRKITIDDVSEERVTTSWYYIADRWIDCRLFSLFLVERRRVDYPELIIGGKNTTGRNVIGENRSGDD